MSNQPNSVLLSKSKNIATLFLNRPHVRNALDIETIKLLTQYIQEIDQDNDTQLLVLRGNGEHFSAGADLNWMKESVDYSLENNKQDALHLATLMSVLYLFSKPVITLVQGAIYGGAIGLVACSDIVIACDNAQFCFSEVKLGLIPAIISPYVISIIGQHQASRYFLTAEVFDAEKAKELGLVHEIINIQLGGQNHIDDILNEWITVLQKNGPQALIKCKQLIRSMAPLNYPNITTQLIAECRASSEGQEGIKAFLEKRKPNWQNR